MGSTNLQKVQARLEALGVRDVKFCFSEEMRAMPLSEAKQSVAEVLESYLDCKGKKFPLFGDSKQVN